MATSTDLVGGYTNPPLQNLERASEWLETLPRDNLDAARAHILHVMRNFSHSRELLTVDGVNTLLHLDEGCQPTLVDILRDFLQNSNGDVAKTNELCREMDAIYRELADAYARFIRVYYETRTSTKQISEFMALVMGRALYCLGNRAKWNYFCQRVMDGDAWITAHAVYRLAEKDGLLSTKLMLYARPYEISSHPGALYVRTVMLDTLRSGNFLPTQIETADHWLTSWSVQNTPEPRYIPEKHFFATNLNFAGGARRAHASRSNEDNRYLQTEYLAIEIARAKDRLREGEIQFALGFIAKQPINEYLSLLDRLAVLWSPEGVSKDQRGDKRVPINDETVQAIRGLNGLCECARQDYEKAHGPMDLNRGLSRDEEMDLQVYGFITERTRSKLRSRPLDATQPIPAVEQWQLRDESVDGYGVSFPGGQYRHLKLGALVGLKRRRSERWVVGVVTRLQTNKRPDENVAGVEIFTYAPVIVIVNEDVLASNAETSRSSWGLFIPGDKQAGRRDSLVIDGALYALKKQILMSARNVRYIVQLKNVLRSGDGWQRIEFEVVSKRDVNQK